MAIAIKSIPTLKGNDAKSFVRAANKAETKRATIDYSRQAKTARSILGKANSNVDFVFTDVPKQELEKRRIPVYDYLIP